MNEFFQMVKKVDPKADVKAMQSLIDSALAKAPYLNEEDLQQLVLMMGVSQGSFDPQTYMKLMVGRDTESNLPRFFQEAQASGGNKQFSELAKMVKG